MNLLNECSNYSVVQKLKIQVLIQVLSLLHWICWEEDHNHQNHNEGDEYPFQPESELADVLRNRSWYIPAQANFRLPVLDLLP